MFPDQPVFGICGYSGSGKTTLLEHVVPQLVRQGLSVAVIKHDVHGIDRDPPGKDSDRLLRAGADVVVHGPGETLARICHTRDASLAATLDRLVPGYDLVLLEGFKNWPGRKAWLMKSDETALPDGVDRCDLVLPWDADRPALLEDALLRFLAKQAQCEPVLGCVLIGGASTRMGRPKHLLEQADGSGQTWLHRAVRVLQSHCRQVVLAGCGEIPGDLCHLPRLPDPLGVKGPAAGLVSAMRWAPRASWLLSACDLPFLSPAAVAWLLSQRAPGVWALLPRLSPCASVEPLLAWYSFRCGQAVERIAAAQSPAIRLVAEHPKCLTVAIPSHLAHAWHDVDTPAEALLRRSSNGAPASSGARGIRAS